MEMIQWFSIVPGINIEVLSLVWTQIIVSPHSVPFARVPVSLGDHTALPLLPSDRVEGLMDSERTVSNTPGPVRDLRLLFPPPGRWLHPDRGCSISPESRGKMT